MTCRSYLVLLLTVLLGGCSPYVEGFDYLPHPALAEVPATPPQTSPPVSAYASVIGVFRGDRDQHIPFSIQLRLRLDNNGPDVVHFDPQSMTLTTGSLLRFLPPVLQPPAPITLAARQSLLVDAFFPFPPGQTCDNTDLSSLQAQWEVAIGNHPVRQVVFFRRSYRIYYYDPYWDEPDYPYFGWYGGGVFIHGGWGHGGWGHGGWGHGRGR